MDSMQSTAFIDIEGATFRGPHGPVFPKTTLTFRPGECWAVIGPSGGEKALFFAALMGKLPLLAGHLRHPFLEGDPRFVDSVYGVLPPGSLALASMEEHGQWLLARDFHQLRWHASLTSGTATVAQLLQRNVIEQRNPFAVLDDDGDDAFDQARNREIVRFGLGPLLDRPIVALSNGELHRFVLARALLRRPRLLFIDDPMAGLDAETRGRMREILAELDGEGIAVVVGVESEGEIPAAATHVLRLRNGAVESVGQHRRAARHAGADVRRMVIPSQPTRSPAPGIPMLDMVDVTVRHGDITLLDGITWTIEPGEQWALLGPNGSGKSTLLSLVLADNPQTWANHVRIAGFALDVGRSIWEQKAWLGWLSPELEAHYPPCTPALDVVLSGLRSSLGLHTKYSAADEREARSWLDYLGLAAEARVPLAALSPLHRRLLLLARAVVHRPSLLLFDEPCQGLDSGDRLALGAAATAAVRALGAAMIYVTHDTEEIPATVANVLRLDRGRIVYCGSR